MGADTFRKAVAANPLNCLRMLNTLSRLTAGGLKCERHLAEQVERKAVLARTSSRSRKRIEQEFCTGLHNPRLTEANRRKTKVIFHPRYACSSSS
jgi:hypothetical protein